MSGRIHFLIFTQNAGVIKPYREHKIRMDQQITIRWGIIGCGDVTELKSGPAFNLVEGSKIIAVMRRNGEKAADYAHRHGIAKWYDNADELLYDAEINSIYIATPPAFHKDYAIKALKLGHNVYIEKPVTLNAAEAREIAAAAAVSTGKLTIAHYRRAVPMFLYIKELLDRKVIGELRTIQIRMWQPLKPALIAETEENWRLDPAISGGGYFHDLAPHQLDLMLYYFGAPKTVHGFSLNQSKASQAPDHTAGIALFENDIVMNGSWSFNIDEEEEVDECLMAGSKGSITFPFFGKSVLWQNEETDEIQVIPFEHPAHIQHPMIERVVEFFQGAAENPCTIDEAIIVMSMIDALSVNP